MQARGLVLRYKKFLTIYILWLALSFKPYKNTGCYVSCSTQFMSWIRSSVYKTGCTNLEFRIFQDQFVRLGFRLCFQKVIGVFRTILSRILWRKVGLSIGVSQSEKIIYGKMGLNVKMYIKYNLICIELFSHLTCHNP